MAYTQKGMTQTFGNTTATTITRLQDNGCDMIPANGPFGNKTIGPRTVIVPADPIIWNENTSYEYLTLVASADFGASYISKRDVPSGTPLTDTDYWIKTGEFNAQLANIEDMIEDIDALIAMGFDVITPENTQEEIQQTLNEKALIVFSEGTYNVEMTGRDNGVYYGLSIPSNKFIIMGGATFTIPANSYSNYNILYMEGASNVTIIGRFTVVGDKGSHTASEGEWGHCFSIFGGSAITVDGLTAKDGWGDGLYLASLGETHPSNIMVTNVTADNCRRNGISVTAGDNVFIERAVISNISGTNPQSGIDIEPNTAGEIGYVSVKNFTVVDCTGAAIQLACHNNEGNYTLTVQDFFAKGCKEFVAVTDTSGEISVSNITAIGNTNFVEFNAFDGLELEIVNAKVSGISGYLTVSNYNSKITYTNMVLSGTVNRYVYTASGKTHRTNLFACDISAAPFNTTDNFNNLRIINCMRGEISLGSDNQAVNIYPSARIINMENNSNITVGIVMPYIGIDFVINTGESSISLNAGSYSIVRPDGTSLNTYQVAANKTVMLTAVSPTKWVVTYMEAGE